MGGSRRASQHVRAGVFTSDARLASVLRRVVSWLRVIRPERPRSDSFPNGGDVKDRNNDAAFFQQLSSSPATLEASKAVNTFGLFPEHEVQQSDAEQAYTQTTLRAPPPPRPGGGGGAAVIH